MMEDAKVDDLTEIVTSLAKEVKTLSNKIENIEDRISKLNNNIQSSIEDISFSIRLLEIEEEKKRLINPSRKLKPAPLSRDGIGIYGYAAKI